MTLYAIGLVIDQARKDGFQFRNIDDMYHPSTNISSEEDPKVSGVPELREKQGFEELEKDEHLMLDCAPGGTLVDFIPISQMILFLSKKKCCLFVFGEGIILQMSVNQQFGQ